MKFKELKLKNDKELKAMVVADREKLQALKFKVAAKQMKDVREVREVRKEIAQLMTLLEQRKNEAKKKK